MLNTQFVPQSIRVTSLSALAFQWHAIAIPLHEQPHFNGVAMKLLQCDLFSPRTQQMLAWTSVFSASQVAFQLIDAQTSA